MATITICEYAAMPIFESVASRSTRTTLPEQRTRMLSVNVISGGNVSVNSMGEPSFKLESK